MNMFETKIVTGVPTAVCVCILINTSKFSEPNISYHIVVA